MSLLFNMLSRLVIAFLPRSKHLLNTQISKHNQSIKVLWWSNAHLFFPFDFMYALLNYLHTKYFLFLTLKLKIIFRDTDEIVKRLSCLYFGKTRFLVTAILYTFLDEKSILYMIVILQWQKMCHFFYSGLLFYKCFWLWCSLHLPLEAHLSMNPQPAKIAQLCLTLCNSMDRSPPGSSVCGIPQVRILEWVVIPFSRGSSQLRNWTLVSHTAGKSFTFWATRKVPSMTSTLN